MGNSSSGESGVLSVVWPEQSVGKRHGSWLDLPPAQGKRGPGSMIDICHTGQAREELQRSESARKPFSQRNDYSGARGTLPVCSGGSTGKAGLDRGKAAVPACWQPAGAALAPKPAGGSPLAVPAVRLGLGEATLFQMRFLFMVLFPFSLHANAEEKERQRRRLGRGFSAGNLLVPVSLPKL